MTIGIIGQKMGMTRLFTEDASSIPVTVIAVMPNYVTHLMTVDSHGYNAVQVAWGVRGFATVNKAKAGYYAKIGLETGEGLLEYRVNRRDLERFQTQSEIKVDLFTVGQKVDVTGKTKGKGFSGVIKRHHFSGQRNTHGNSLSHRAPGSIGQCQTPGRVFKGKKMAGQLGNVKRTIQNLEVVQVDNERRLLLIKGSVPAAKGSRVVVTPAIKHQSLSKGV